MGTAVAMTERRTPTCADRPVASRSTDARMRRFASRVGEVVSNPLGVVAASLASFLVVLALLTARVSNGHDPALARGAAGGARVSRDGRIAVRTNASGRPLARPAGAGGAESSPSLPGAVLSRPSGAPGATGAGDD
jgi:hypothetical protein